MSNTEVTVLEFAAAPESTKVDRIDCWTPPPLVPVMPAEDHEAKLAVEWAASGMPTAGSSK